jgi:glycosyltransferase involved in cell wall biosynthesis
MSVSEFSQITCEARGQPLPPAQHIVVGITDAQTCKNLTGRLRALGDAGFRVTLVSAPGDLLLATAREQGATAIALPMRRGIAPVADLISFWGVLRLLKRLRPDLSEFSSPKAGLLGNLAAKLAGVPARVYMLRGLKFETAAGLQRMILVQAEWLAAACAHVVLCNSESVRTKALELGIVPPTKLRLLGGGSTNGVNLERFSPGPSDVRERMGIPDEAPVVGFVGRFTRDKGVPELIEAFGSILKEQPEARLLLVGWFDESEDALSADARAGILKHDHIHCTDGMVEDTAPYYRAMDLLVLPTWREGFPNVVLEAAATGIPAVTTESTGSRDSVVPEVTGLLIPPGYPEAIAEAVLSLLRDPTRRRRMGQAARAWASEHYSDKRVLGMTVEFYRELLRERTRQR